MFCPGWGWVWGGICWELKGEVWALNAQLRASVLLARAVGAMQRFGPSR